ncbi:hypothetical protein AXK11_06270 [Cephaloticoccus primus]|uniref:Uncharacterized protein n=1 Tax=Cephaloticoccus primus TaxID=1548207 RepID=A0A139SLQ2_9BACT|nr:hypothetical protein [Cephaloticoccus primus]KXU35482.1 hypothetical protein AXK11_06270 [Cephaloticoccus primus]
MKNNTHAFAHPLLITTLVMICLAGSIGMGTVWMRHQISMTANRTKLLQARLTETERLINSTRADVERAQDPAMLKLLNAQWKLGLVPPDPQKTATLDEVPVPYLAAKHNRELFGDLGEDFPELARPQATTVSFKGASVRRGN